MLKQTKQPIKIHTTLELIFRLELWLVAGAVAAGMVSSRLLPLAVAVEGVYVLLRIATRKRIATRTSADLAIGLLLLTVPVTLWATALPELTHPQVWRLLSGVALLYALVNWLDGAPRLPTAFWMFTLAGGGLALFALVSVQWPLGKLTFIPDALYQNFQVLVSDAVHPNVMAGALALLLPLPFAILLAGPRLSGWGGWLLALVIAALMVAVLVLTRSRGGWIGAALALLLLFTLSYRFGWVALPFGALLTATLLTRYGVETALEYLSTGGVIGGVDGRVEIWSRAIYMIQDFPFTGVGIGSFMRVADVFYPFFLYPPGRIDHAHNLILQIAVDLGLPGLIAWLSILLLALQAAWRAYRRAYWRAYRAGGRLENSWLRVAGAAVLSAQCALLLHGLFDAVLWGMVRPAPLVWAVFGLALACGAMVEQQIAPEPSTPSPEIILDEKHDGE